MHINSQKKRSCSAKLNINDTSSHCFSSFLLLLLKKIIKRFPLIVLISILSACFVFSTKESHAACSTIYKGKATINEVAGKTSGDPTFIEVKLLDLSINSNIYDSWTLHYCTKSGTCEGPTALSTSNDSDLPYIVTTPPTSSPEDYIDFKNGMDIILQDASGNTIDYLSIGGQKTTTPAIYDANCTTFSFDWEYPKDSSTKGIMRMPDGTGDWFSCPGGSCDDSTGDTNDPLPPGGDPFPRVNVTGATVTQGGDVTFTISMLDDAHPVYDTIINYQTLDGTAIASTDYTATSGSITFPATTKATDLLATQSLTVSTNGSSGTTTDVYFWLNITCSTINIGTAKNPVLVGTASIINNYAQGFILYTLGPPAVSVSDESEVKGTDIIFTITLENNANAGYDTVINYQTIDATAVAGTDHTATSGTITFPKGTTAGATQTVTVTTNGSSPSTSDVHFLLYIVSPIDPTEGGPTANISDHYGRGDILASSSPAGPDHLEIIHAGSALTCTPETITVRICEDTNVPCTLYTNDVDVTIASTSGNWTTSTKTISGGSGTFELRDTTAETVTLSIASSSPSASNTFTCWDGSAASCNLTFNNSGFIFNVGTQVSCQTSSDITISAMQTSPGTNICIPAYENQEVSIDFWSTYQNPNPPTVSADVSLTRTIAAGTNTFTLSQNSGSPSAITLSFNASGDATFKILYPEAGQISIDAQRTDAAGFTMTGNSTFVVGPAGLCVYSNDTDADCASGDATCTDFVAAGQTFNLGIKAVCYETPGETNTDFCTGNATTQNFQLNNIAISSNLVAPATGVNGTVGAASFSMVSADNGDHVISNQTIDEVGVFNFSANPGNYLGAGDIIPTSTSDNIGRFIPDHLTVTSNSITPACTSFTYMDQNNLGVAFNIEAQNTANAVTQNYFGNFAKATFSLTAENANDGNNLAGRLSSLPAPLATWAAGVYPLNIGSAAFNRLVAPDGPYDTLDIGFIITNNEASLTGGGYDMDPDASTDCVALLNCTARKIGTTETRFGRFDIGNAFGPETDDLLMQITTLYFDGTDFVLNASDTCTSLTNAPAGPPQWGDILLPTASYTDNLAETETIPTSISFSNGTGNVTLSAPGNGNDGSVGVTLDLTTNLPWLQFDWDNDGSHNNDPSATATFGIYRGNDRIINWQEIFR